MQQRRGKSNFRYDPRNPAMALIGGRRLVQDRREGTEQVTGDDILREAAELNRALEKAHRERQPVLSADAEESKFFRQKHREELEVRVRRDYADVRNWILYAEWEESEGDIGNSRSVYERAMDHHGASKDIWRHYAEMEIRQMNIDRTRAVWNRAVLALPAAEELWIRYLLYEQSLGDDDRARELFNRWLAYKPQPFAWKLFVRFEISVGQVNRAREVLGRFVCSFNVPSAWLFFALTEVITLRSTQKGIETLRTALDALPQRFSDCRIHTLLAHLLQMNNEFEEARLVLREALEGYSSPREIDEVLSATSAFERLFGQASDFTAVIVAKRRLQYEKELERSTSTCETWASYAKLEEDAGYVDRAVAILDRSLAAEPEVPASASVGEEVRLWTPFVQLWLRYVELLRVEEQRDKARSTLKTLLLKVPKHLGINDVWMAAGALEFRAGQISAFRKIMGTAIGTAPSPELFRFYIQAEALLGNFDRVCKLYETFLQKFPSEEDVWVEYADVTSRTGDQARAEAILLLASEIAKEDESVSEDKFLRALVASKVKRGDFEGARQIYYNIFNERIDAAGRFGAQSAAEDALRDAVEAIVHFELAVASETAVGVAVVRSWFMNEESSTRAKGFSDVWRLIVALWRDFEAKYGDDQTLRQAEEAAEAPTRKRSRLMKMAAK